MRKPYGIKPYGAAARPENLPTDDDIDAFVAAILGVTVEELRPESYDANAPELTDEEISQLLD